MQGVDLPIRQDIAVEVEVSYLADQSSPNKHLFVYFITIHNRGSERVQLLEREWFIQDGTLPTQYLRGTGVVGQQPILEPAQSHRYNSYCSLELPPGWMQGFYIFQTQLGRHFKVEIPRFELRLPSPRTLN